MIPVKRYIYRFQIVWSVDEVFEEGFREGVPSDLSVNAWEHSFWCETNAVSSPFSVVHTDSAPVVENLGRKGWSRISVEEQLLQPEAVLSNGSDRLSTPAPPPTLFFAKCVHNGKFRQSAQKLYCAYWLKTSLFLFLFLFGSLYFFSYLPTHSLSFSVSVSLYLPSVSLAAEQLLCGRAWPVTVH